MQVPAASKNYMKKMNGSWDLKTNKTVAFKTNYAGIGMKKDTAKITNYKITDAPDKRYNILTFNVSFKVPWEFSPSQVHKICKLKYFKKIIVLRVFEICISLIMIPEKC